MRRVRWCAAVICVLAISVQGFGVLSAKAQGMSVSGGGAASLCASGGSRLDAALAGRANRALVAGGFANVRAFASGECLAVAYENGRYRDERRALREAAALLAPLRGADRDLVLVPMHRGVPIAAVSFTGASAAPSGDGSTAVHPAVSLDLRVVPPELFDAPRSGSSAGRLDIVVHPWFQARFGAFDNPVASRTGVAPELRMEPWPGLRVSAQALLTLQDDVPTGESRVRPGLVTVSQLVRLPGNVFASATAGTFNPDRYGADVQARAYFANGRLFAGGQVGLTGGVAYAREGWHRTPMRDPTALADAGVWIPSHDLVVRATAGVFLADERGVRLDVSRRFGEVEIGWFLLASEEGGNGGMVLRIPLVPARYGRPAPVRVRPAETFRWQYRYRAAVPGGWRYETGDGLEETIRRRVPIE